MGSNPFGRLTVYISTIGWARTPGLANRVPQRLTEVVFEPTSRKWMKMSVIAEICDLLSVNTGVKSRGILKDFQRLSC